MRYFSLKKAGVLLIALWISIGVPAVGITDSPIWAPPDLARLIEEGLIQNKEIKSLEDRVESMKKEIPYAGSLADPRLGFAILNLPTDTFDFDQEAMTQKQIFIAQKFPWFGKLDLRTQRAALKAVRQQAVLDARRLELARKIAVAYYELGFMATSLQTNARLTEIVNQLLGVAETRYATGRGLQQDVLHAQVELSKLLDEKITLDKRRRTLEDQINELLNRESFIAVPPPMNVSYPDLQLEIERLQDKALKENPQLRVRQAQIDITAMEIELARKDYWPDMDVKLAYGQREKDLTGRDLPDFVSGTVTMNIPLWQNSRQDSKLAAVKKDHQAAINFYRNLVESLPHRVDALVTEIRDTQKNYRLFSDALLLQADQWASSALSAYEVGAVEFNTMIGAQIRLLRFELQNANYMFRIYQKRAELEETLGGPL
jgi:cobalt-zinc-cadmium efflux system outer membrane protein